MYVPVQKGNLNLCVGETHLRVLSVSGGATYQMEGSVWKNLEATVGRGCFFYYYQLLRLAVLRNETE
jgi:hypothetical protein